MPRLFVAVRPPDEVLDLVEALPRPAAAGVRYTTRPQWHVTLRFLGSCEVGEAIAALRTVEGAPVDAVLGPRVSRLGRRVIAVPVAGLDALAAEVVDRTRSIGEPPGSRPFVGHLTVARLRSGAGGSASASVVGSPVDARFRVDEVTLVASDLQPDGARYEVVQRWPLRGSGAGFDHGRDG